MKNAQDGHRGIILAKIDAVAAVDGHAQMPRDCVTRNAAVSGIGSALHLINEFVDESRRTGRIIGGDVIENIG